MLTFKTHTMHASQVMVRMEGLKQENIRQQATMRDQQRAIARLEKQVRRAGGTPATSAMSSPRTPRDRSKLRTPSRT